MRALIAGCALLLIGSAAAQSQPYYDGDGYPPRYDDGYGHRPPPPYDDGYGHRPSPPPPYDGGYGHRPPPDRYGEDFDRPPPRHHRHCRIVEDFDGPHRICRPDF
jgi:hypothetical protein